VDTGFATPEPFTSAHRRQIVELAAQYRLPATYGLRDFVVDGGLMSCAPDISDIFGRSSPSNFSFVHTSDRICLFT
jgi:hypothetical protein